MLFPRSRVMRFAGLVLAALGIFLLADPVVAQNRRPSYGVQGGVTFANFGGGDIGDGENRTGFQLGGFATFPVGSHVAIQPTALYSQEGTQSDANGLTGTIRLDYIEVPLLLKLSPNLEGSPLHPFLVVGPAVGFQVSCSVQVKTSGQSVERPCADSAAAIDTKPVQLGVHFGVGLEFGRLAVGLAYQLGLTSIDNSGADASVRNRVMAIVVGYRLGGKH